MRAKKVDLTHGEIRDYLESVGWAVRSTAIIGDNFPDLAVARDRFTALVECKSASGKLTPGQRKFKDEWPGVVIEARSGEDAAAQLDMAQDDQRKAIHER